MMISNCSFHLLSLILLVSFSFSFAHFRHIAPKEIDPKSFNSHSSPLSPLTSKGSGLLSGSSSSKDSSLFDNLSRSNASGSSKISDSSSVSTNSKGLDSDMILH